MVVIFLTVNGFQKLLMETVLDLNSSGEAS